MTKSPFLNFLMGVVAGGLLATLLCSTSSRTRWKPATPRSLLTVGTIVYQKQPLASFPILHGMAAFDLNDAAQPKPSLYIPAQVDIYTDRPDVRYAWIDGRSGVQQGAIRVAQSPSAVQ